MKSSSKESQDSQAGLERKWYGNTKLKPNEPDCWALADSDEGIYLITARTRDSKDQLARILIYVFEGRDLVNTPIAAFKVDCLMMMRVTRLVVSKLADLLASNTLTPWELRDKVFKYDEIVRIEPREPIYGTSRGQKAYGYENVGSVE